MVAYAGQSQLVKGSIASMQALPSIVRTNE